MLFRLQHEEFIDINRKDFMSSNEYYTAIMNVYGVKMPYVGIRDDVIQLDYISSLITPRYGSQNMHTNVKHQSRL